MNNKAVIGHILGVLGILLFIIFLWNFLGMYNDNECVVKKATELCQEYGLEYSRTSYLPNFMLAICQDKRKFNGEQLRFTKEEVEACLG